MSGKISVDYIMTDILFLKRTYKKTNWVTLPVSGRVWTYKGILSSELCGFILGTHVHHLVQRSATVFTDNRILWVEIDEIKEEIGWQRPSLHEVRRLSSLGCSYSSFICTSKLFHSTQFIWTSGWLPDITIRNSVWVTQI